MIEDLRSVKCLDGTVALIIGLGELGIWGLTVHWRNLWRAVDADEHWGDFCLRARRDIKAAKATFARIEIIRAIKKEQARSITPGIAAENTLVAALFANAA